MIHGWQLITIFVSCIISEIERLEEVKINEVRLIIYILAVIG